MAVIQREIAVRYRLQVHFTRGAFAPSNPLLREVLGGDGTSGTLKVLVVLDEGLASAQPALVLRIEAYFAVHADRVRLVCPPVRIEGGEGAKNSFPGVSEIHAQVDRYHLDRHSYVVAVGGGAVLDMVGLAAATAHRGVRYVRLPSTTLSQCDSGVGVKNGINAFGKKNFIGTFAPPFAVINDFDLLASLPPRDRRAGYVEAVKVALIRDAEFFAAIERSAPALCAFEPTVMQWLIHRCAELHLDHIATCGDPFEFGTARPLDFGHWAAHKLETLSDYRLRHGEAVAIGIALDTIYSRDAGLLDPASTERALALLEGLGFDLFASELRLAGPRGTPLVLEGLEEFREHLGGQLTITLLQSIGQGVEVHEVHPPGVVAALLELEVRHRRRLGPAPAADGAG